MSIKDLFNTFKYIDKGHNTNKYEQERIPDLIQKGYSSI